MRFQFQALKGWALSSFNTGFDTVNLHRPTLTILRSSSASMLPLPSRSNTWNANFTFFSRRKLNLSAKFEYSLS